MSDEAPRLHRSQAAWNDFADALKRIGEKITLPTGARGERERAEGYRYLMRLISGAHDLEMESDRRFPVLTRMMTGIRKFKGDGTDTLYREAKLDERYVYKFTLRRGDDLFRRVPQNRRTVTRHVVDVRVVVDVGDVAALGLGDHRRGAPHRRKRPHRRVDAAHQHLARTLKLGV